MKPGRLINDLRYFLLARRKITGGSLIQINEKMIKQKYCLLILYFNSVNSMLKILKI